MRIEDRGTAPMSTKPQIAVVASAFAVIAGQLIWAADEGSPAPVTTSHSAGRPSNTSETLQEVTVTANRFELEKRYQNSSTRSRRFRTEKGLRAGVYLFVRLLRAFR